MLKITVGKRDQLDQRTRRRLQAAADGEPLEESPPQLDVDSYAELSRILSPTNLELLETIAAHDPESIDALVDLLNQDSEQVDRALSELETIGMIEFESGNFGMVKRPILIYDSLEVDILFSRSDSDSAVES